jgi:hypothetical protein
MLPRALAKAAAKRTHDDLPVHSFDTLLGDLATICLNQIQPADPALPGFQLITTPTPLQRRAFDLLSVSHRHGIAQSATHPAAPETPGKHTCTRIMRRDFGLTRNARREDFWETVTTLRSGRPKIAGPVEASRMTTTEC